LTEKIQKSKSKNPYLGAYKGKFSQMVGNGDHTIIDLLVAL